VGFTLGEVGEIEGSPDAGNSVGAREGFMVECDVGMIVCMVTWELGI